MESISTESDDEDTELLEEQAAVNHRQELMGDPLSSVVQFENLDLGNIKFPNIFY